MGRRYAKNHYSNRRSKWPKYVGILLTFTFIYLFAHETSILFPLVTNKNSPKYLPNGERVAYPGENSITVKGVPAPRKTIQNGVFIEMGANEGLNSNSHYLEQKHGWHGLCIEAGPMNYGELVKNRPKCTNINAVVAEKVGEQIFREFSGTLFGHSGFVDGRTTKEWDSLIADHPDASYEDLSITTNTMAGIFKENNIKNIDYFSLDVEGYEMKILAAYPFDDHPVRLWTIESNKLDRKMLLQFMGERNYLCFHYDNVNTICEKK